MQAPIRTLSFLLILGLLAPGTALAGGGEKKQIAFIARTMKQRLKTIRDQLRANKLSLAERNMRGLTESLREMARLTKRVRRQEPGFTPNPPAGCQPGPATARQAEYLKAKGLAIAAGKRLNRDAQAANAALLKAKNQQIATIAISALKFTIENAPGRQGGKVGDLAVEAIKKLNGYLMETYVAQPISGISEVTLLKGNFVKIRDGARLLARLEKSREQVIGLAKQMDQRAKTLDKAVAAERAWKEFAWLCSAGSGKLKVQVVDLRARDLELTLAGHTLGPKAKGQTFTIDSQAIVAARVRGPRRKFCVERREYAKRTKSIIIHPGPGGGPADSLVYSSSRIPAKSAWTIQAESFSWKPSFNSRIEAAPRAVGRPYWKPERDRMRWSIEAEPGEQVNVKVDGTIHWRFESNIRGKRRKKDEKNTGSATLVLKVLE